MRQKRYFQTASYGRERPKRGFWFLGVLLGIVLGITAVVGVAIYLNYVSSPFIQTEDSDKSFSVKEGHFANPAIQNTEQSPEALPGKSAHIKALDHSEETASSHSKDFDFYKILPGKSEVVLKNRPSVPEATPNVFKYYLQVGAFQEAKDANNLKARLALIGIHAFIQSIQIEGRGLVHRVRIGPLNEGSIEAMKVLLKQNGFQATFVKF